jgi:hypothetical protein
MRELVAQGHIVRAHVLSPPAPMDGVLSRDPVHALEAFAPCAPAMVFCRDAAHERRETCWACEAARP